MTFIRTQRGIYLNLAEVREAVASDGDTMVLHMLSGATRRARREDWYQAICQQPLAAVAAEPNTYLLNAVRSGDGVQIIRERVIGWSLGGFRNVSVITPLAVRDVDHEVAVLLPDGSVQDLLNLYDDYDEWLQDVTETILGTAASAKAHTKSTIH